MKKKSTKEKNQYRTVLKGLKVGECFILTDLTTMREITKFETRFRKEARELKVGITIRRARRGLEVWKTANKIFYPPKE